MIKIHQKQWEALWILWLRSLRTTDRVDLNDKNHFEKM